VSYSHKDERWKDRLVAHLGVLQHQGLLNLWDDRRIRAGADWEQEIQAAMDAASVAVVLVSANSLTSQFILRTEVSHLLQRRDREVVRIFPIIAKPCDWRAVDWLCRMQCQPKDGVPLSSLRAPQADEKLSEIAREIRSMVGEPAPAPMVDPPVPPAAPGRTSDPANPFFWRGGISDPDAFFDREQEQNTLRTFLGGRQNCQIVGPAGSARPRCCGSGESRGCFKNVVGEGGQPLAPYGAHHILQLRRTRDVRIVRGG
jgi:hypothetical protein